MLHSFAEPLNLLPVHIPYTVRSDLYQLGKMAYGQVEHSIFRLDSEYQYTATERLALLKTHPDHCRLYLSDDADALYDCLWTVADHVAADQPQFAQRDGDQFSSRLLGLSLGRDGAIAFNPDIAAFPDLGQDCFDHLQSLSPLGRLCDLLVLSVQEDIAIGKLLPANGGADAPHDVMECLLMAFPSHWSPQQKIGLSFANVHAPIPASERLVSASDRLVKAISTKGPFIRYNWTFSTVHLCRNPGLAEQYERQASHLFDAPDLDTFLDRLYFRVERQTFIPFPAQQRYMFAIHTYLTPIHTALNTAERWDTMMAALESVPDIVLTHRKNLGKIIAALAEYNQLHRS